MAETNAQTVSPVKRHVDYANQQVDEQAILDKYNAATVAQFNVQREQNRQAENQFYNQMYNTQRTAMDTIRQANAAAVSTGASRGVQAANELSALLGLQSESVASATELAQANRQTAQEETAKVLENVLNAYQQATQERQQLVSQGIEAASVEAQESANQIAAAQAQAQLQQAQTEEAKLRSEAANNDTNTYLNALQGMGIDYSDGVVTPESQASLNTALDNIGKTKEGDMLSFNAKDWSGGNSGADKAAEITATINNICNAYGLNSEAYKQDLEALTKIASNSNVSWVHANIDKAALEKLGITEKSLNTIADHTKTNYAAMVQQGYQNILTRIRNDYAEGKNRKTKK